MRVTISMPSTGVFHAPGLAKTVTIDAKNTPDDKLEKLRALVEGARFFEQPAVVGGKTAKSRDARQLGLVIEMDGRQHAMVHNRTHFRHP